MKTENKTAITVEATVKAPIDKVWKYWSEPEHIKNWCFASNDWHAPHAENDLRTGGKFKTTMAAKDGSVGFDFEGTYSDVKPLERIEYQLGDSRNVEIVFINLGEATKVSETFDPESENSVELQKGGWQAILNNFKSYVESQK